MENTTVKMAEVKLDCKFVGEVFSMTYRQGVEKGEKYDREKSEIFHTAEYNLSELPENIYLPCDSGKHGIKQKMSDNLAMKAETKATTSIAECLTMEQELWEQLKAGNWNAPTGATKAPSIKLNDLEAKFVAGITAGLMTYEMANNLYKGITGKDLPQPE